MKEKQDFANRDCAGLWYSFSHLPPRNMREQNPTVSSMFQLTQDWAIETFWKCGGFKYEWTALICVEKDLCVMCSCAQIHFVLLFHLTRNWPSLNQPRITENKHLCLFGPFPTSIWHFQAFVVKFPLNLQIICTMLSCSGQMFLVLLSKIGTSINYFRHQKFKPTFQHKNTAFKIVFKLFVPHMALRAARVSVMCRTQRYSKRLVTTQVHLQTCWIHFLTSNWLVKDTQDPGSGGWYWQLRGSVSCASHLGAHMHFWNRIAWCSDCFTRVDKENGTQVIVDLGYIHECGGPPDAVDMSGAGVKPNWLCSERIDSAASNF